MALGYSVGSRVDALYDSNADDVWYPGRIQRVTIDDDTTNATYDVLYDDGDVERNVTLQCLRAHVAGTLCVGTRVFARYAGGDEWYPGKVADVLDGGCFMIEYDDAEVEANVPLAYIKEPDDDVAFELAGSVSEATAQYTDVDVAETAGELDEQQGGDATSSRQDARAADEQRMHSAVEEQQSASRGATSHDSTSAAHLSPSRDVAEPSRTQSPAPEMERPRFRPRPQQSVAASTVDIVSPDLQAEPDEYASIVESITLLESRLSDAGAIKTVLSTLVKQMRAYPQVTADLVHARNGERLVLSVLAFHDAHAVIQCYGFVLLRRLCFLCPKSTHFFLRHGILDAVTAAMRTFADDAILQAAACGALAVFTRVHAGLERLRAHDVAHNVLATIAYHKTYSIHTRQVHYYACEVLLELCELGDATTLDALCRDQVGGDDGQSDVAPIALLLFLLRQGLSFDDKKASCAVGTLLMCLAATNRYAAGRILCLNGLQELSTTMATYATESGIQKYSASASQALALASIDTVALPTKRVQQRAADVLEESSSLEALHQGRYEYEHATRRGRGSDSSQRRPPGTTSKRKAAPLPQPSMANSGYASPPTRTYHDAQQSFSKFASPIGKAPYLPAAMATFATGASVPQHSSLVILDSSRDAETTSQRKQQFVKDERQSLLFETYGVAGSSTKDARASQPGIKRKQLKTHLVSAAETTWATPVVSPKRLVRDAMLAGPPATASYSHPVYSRSRPDSIGMGAYALPTTQRSNESFDDSDTYSYAQQSQSQSQPAKRKPKKKLRTPTSYGTGYRETFQVKIESDTALHVSKELRSPIVAPLGSPIHKQSKSSGKPLGTKASTTSARSALGGQRVVSRKPLPLDPHAESLTTYAAKLFHDDFCFGSDTDRSDHSAASIGLNNSSLATSSYALSAREQAELQERERLSFAEKLHKMIDKAKSSLATSNVVAAPLEQSTRSSSRSATGAATTSSSKAAGVSNKARAPFGNAPRARAAVDSSATTDTQSLAPLPVATALSSQPKTSATTLDVGRHVGSNNASRTTAKRVVVATAPSATAAAVPASTAAVPKPSAGTTSSAARTRRSTDSTKTSNATPKSTSSRAKPAALAPAEARPVEASSKTEKPATSPSSATCNETQQQQQPLTDATSTVADMESVKSEISYETAVGAAAAVLPTAAFTTVRDEHITDAQPASVEPAATAATDTPVTDSEQSVMSSAAADVADEAPPAHVTLSSAGSEQDTAATTTESAPHASKLEQSAIDTATEAATALDGDPAPASDSVELVAPAEEPIVAAADQTPVDEPTLSRPTLESSSESGDTTTSMDVETPAASSDAAPMTNATPDDVDDVSSEPRSAEAAVIAGAAAESTEVAVAPEDDMYADEYNEFDDDGVGDEATAADALDEQLADATDTDVTALDALLSIADQATAVNEVATAAATELPSGDSDNSVAAAAELPDAEPAVALSSNKNGDGLYAKDAVDAFEDDASEPASARSVAPSSARIQEEPNDVDSTAVESNESVTQVDVELEVPGDAFRVDSTADVEAAPISDAAPENEFFTGSDDATKPEMETETAQSAPNDSAVATDETTPNTPLTPDDAVALDEHSAAADASNESALGLTDELDVGSLTEPDEVGASDALGSHSELEPDAEHTQQTSDSEPAATEEPSNDAVQTVSDESTTNGTQETAAADAADAAAESDDVDRPVSRGADSYADDGFDFDDENESTSDIQPSAVSTNDDDAAAVEVQDDGGAEDAAVPNATERVDDGDSDATREHVEVLAPTKHTVDDSISSERIDERGAALDDELQSSDGAAADVPELEVSIADASQYTEELAVSPDNATTISAPVEESDTPLDQSVATKVAATPDASEASVSEVAGYSDEATMNDVQQAESAESTLAVTESASAGESPADDIDAPTDDVETPVDTIAAPTDNVDAPVDDIDAPTDDVETPVDNVAAPTDSIEAPTDNVDAIVDSVEAATVTAGDDDYAGDYDDYAADGDAELDEAKSNGSHTVGTIEVESSSALKTTESDSVTIADVDAAQHEGEEGDTTATDSANTESTSDERPRSALSDDVADASATAIGETAPIADPAANDANAKSAALSDDPAARDGACTADTAVDPADSVALDTSKDAQLLNGTEADAIEPQSVDTEALDMDSADSPDDVRQPAEVEQLVEPSDAVTQNTNADNDDEGGREPEAQQQQLNDTADETLVARDELSITETPSTGDEGSAPNAAVTDDELSYEDDYADEADETPIHEPLEPVGAAESDEQQPAVDSDAAVELKDDGGDAALTDPSVESNDAQAPDPAVASSENDDVSADAVDATAIKALDAAEPSDVIEPSDTHMDAPADATSEPSRAVEDLESVAVESSLVVSASDGSVAVPDKVTGVDSTDDVPNADAATALDDGSRDDEAVVIEDPDLDAVAKPVDAMQQQQNDYNYIDDIVSPAAAVSTSMLSDGDSIASSDVDASDSTTAAEADTPTQSEDEQTATAEPDVVVVASSTTSNGDSAADTDAPESDGQDEQAAAIVAPVEQQPDGALTDDAKTLTAVESENSANGDSDPFAEAASGADEQAPAEDKVAEPSVDADSETAQQQQQADNDVDASDDATCKDTELVEHPSIEPVLTESPEIDSCADDPDSVAATPRDAAADADVLDPTLDEQVSVDVVSADSDSVQEVAPGQPSQASEDAAEPDVVQLVSPSTSSTDLLQTQSTAALDAYDDFAAADNDGSAGDAEAAPTAVSDDVAGGTEAELPQADGDVDVAGAAAEPAAALASANSWMQQYAVETGETASEPNATSDSSERTSDERSGDAHDESEHGDRVELSTEEVVATEPVEREASSELPVGCDDVVEQSDSESAPDALAPAAVEQTATVDETSATDVDTTDALNAVETPVEAATPESKVAAETTSLPSADDDAYDDFDAEAEAAVTTIDAASSSDAVVPPTIGGSESPAGSDVYDAFENDDDEVDGDVPVNTTASSEALVSARLIDNEVAAETIGSETHEPASTDDEYPDDLDEYNDVGDEGADWSEPLASAGANTSVVGSTGSTPREVDDEGGNDDAPVASVAAAVPVAALDDAKSSIDDDGDDYSDEQATFENDDDDKGDKDDSNKSNVAAAAASPRPAAAVVATDGDDDAENEYENEYDDFDE